MYFSVWRPRYFRVNTLVTTTEDVLNSLVELKFKQLKTPKTYDKFLKLIKSDKFNGNSFVQDFHIKELLVFNSKIKFYNLEDYKNGTLIIQDKVNFVLYLNFLIFNFLWIQNCFNVPIVYSIYMFN